MAAPAINSAMLVDLWKTGKFSDMTLMCQGKNFRLHKFLVCAQSPVIAADIEKTFRDTHTSVIHVTAFDVATVECMVEFLYCDDYAINAPANAWTLPANMTTSTTANGQHVVMAQLQNGSLPEHILREMILCHVQVNAIGHHYQLPKLCGKSLTYIKTMIRDSGSLAVFSDVAVAALKSSKDNKLHEFISSFAVTHGDSLVHSPHLAKLMHFDKFGLGFVKEITTALRERKREITDAKTRETKNQEKVLALQDELLRMKQHVASISGERDGFSEKCRAESDKAAAERDNLKQSLDAEKSMVASLVAERDNLKKQLEAESKKVAAAVSGRDRMKQAYEAEKGAKAAIVVERDIIQKAAEAEREKARGAQANLRSHTDNSEQHRRNAENLLAKIKACHIVVNRTEECRHCFTEFPFWIEFTREEYDPTYVLRCGDCRTRHYCD
ncbi:hypothetical protein FDECE_16104 [Fusarium decemcellulare]|nr:hypothetical protein FDECE_16104 [Fusarium decemcellulare]